MAGTPETAEPPPLFEVESDDSGQFGQPSSRPLREGLAAGTAVMESGFPARLNSRWTASDARSGDRWRLRLPDGQTGILRIDRVGPTAESLVELNGHLEGIPGSEVRMVSLPEAVAGTVFRPGYPMTRILPEGGGRHRLAGWPVLGGPRCGNVDPGPGVGRVLQGPASVRRAAAGGSAGTTAWLDTLFVHTRAAEEASGGSAGMRVLVALAVAEANDAFARSEARVQLRSVAVRAVTYQESGDLATDLARLGRAGDGWLDEVEEWRGHYAADVVCLVTEFENSNQFAGMANQLRDTTVSSLERGYTVCLRPYLVGNYTLPHEVGHLLGCNHDRDNAADGGMEPWSYGARITVEGFVYRTVMAYRPGLQFPHFSNPRVRFRGVPTGFADGPTAADNVRTLNLTSPLLAGVREPPARVGFASATGSIEVRESAGAVRLAWEGAGGLEGTRFQVRTKEGSAREGIDFVPLEREVAPAADEIGGAIEVSVLDNEAADGSREFLVELWPVSTNLGVGPVATVRVLLRDDESESRAPLDTRLKSRPGADYGVNALALEPGGHVLVGGGFTQFGGSNHFRLARVRPDGSPDDSFRVEVKYQVNTVALLPEGRLALGGEFNTVNGLRRNHVAVLQADGTLDEKFLFDPGTDKTVHALIGLSEGRLLAGGDFDTVQRQTARRVVRLTADGQVDTGFDTRLGADDSVFALVPDTDESVWIGGRFRSVEGVPAGGVARLRPNGRLDRRFDVGSGAVGVVRAMTRDGQGRLIVAGEFTQFAGRPAGRIVRLDAASGAVDAMFRVGPGADDAVLALAPGADGSVWLGGRFTRVDGRMRHRVARLLADGSLDPGFDPGVGPNDWVVALGERADGAVVLGGYFTEVNGVPRGGLAALLAIPAGPPRFTVLRRGEPGWLWEAEVLPDQVYQLESSEDLRRWTGIGRHRPTESRFDGEWPGPGGTNAHGFLRLNRVLE